MLTGTFKVAPAQQDATREYKGVLVLRHDCERGMRILPGTINLPLSQSEAATISQHGRVIWLQFACFLQSTRLLAYTILKRCDDCLRAECLDVLRIKC